MNNPTNRQCFASHPIGHRLLSLSANYIRIAQALEKEVSEEEAQETQSGNDLHGNPLGRLLLNTHPSSSGRDSLSRILIYGVVLPLSNALLFAVLC